MGLFCLIIRYRKIGAPTNEVTTPTGMAAETSIALEMMSHPRRNRAPNAAVAGRVYLLSEPSMSLTIWGTTRPTNPITPT